MKFSILHVLFCRKFPIRFVPYDIEHTLGVILQKVCYTFLSDLSHMTLSILYGLFCKKFGTIPYHICPKWYWAYSMQGWQSIGGNRPPFFRKFCNFILEFISLNMKTKQISLHCSPRFWDFIALRTSVIPDIGYFSECFVYLLQNFTQMNKYLSYWPAGREAPGHVSKCHEMATKLASFY